MRSDMNKVVGDRHRVGARLIAKPGRPPRDIEDSAPRMGIRRAFVTGYGRAMKESSLHSTPLIRFLEKQVGRPWNTVYSEICSIFDVRKSANQSALHFLHWKVTTKNLFMQDGKVLEAVVYSAPCAPAGLYVHPQTGVLCHNATTSRTQPYRDVLAAREKKRCLTERTITPAQKVVKDKGCWFLVDYAVIKAPQRRFDASVSFCRDVLTGELFMRTPRPRLTGSTLYAVAKRQISKKEMKRYGVD
jgi:hypothetical protein